tara:strand:- start:462 stop:1178 length:717 start_codon:yes stop_codon:yes gene_type:complete
MSSIFDQYSRLETGLNELKKLTGHAGDATKFGHIKAQLQEPHPGLKTSIEQFRTLRRNGVVESGTEPKSLPDLRELIVAVHERATSEDRSITEDRTFKRCLKLMRDTSKELDEISEGAWRAKTIKRPKPNSQVLNSFEGVNPQEVATLRRLIEGLESLVLSVPTTDTALKTYDRLCAEITKHYGKLESDDLPKEVLEFLRKSQSLSGAPLLMVTEEVLDWLKEKKLLKSFKVHGSHGS